MIWALIVICVLWVLYWSYAILRDLNKFSPIYINRYQCADCAESAKKFIDQTPGRSEGLAASGSPTPNTTSSADKIPNAALPSVKPSRQEPADQTTEQPKPAKKATNAGDNSNSNVVPLFEAPNESDDLKKIKGVGVVMERTLNDLGITTFKQLAEFKKAEVQMVSDALANSNSGFGDRITRDEWVDQAKTLSKKAS